MSPAWGQAPVRPATFQAHTPRWPQSPGHPRPVRPCWSGTGHRHVPGCLHGSSCRTRHRSDSQLLPSLSRVTPSAASEHVSELLGCPISRSLTACCVCLELRPLPSTGITRLPRYCEPLRHPSAPGLSLAGVRLIIPDHASGLPVLRALSLCTCCRHYPGAAAGRTPRSSHPAVSAFPGRVAGSACTSSFSRLAQRLLALRPAHSRGHQFVTRYPKASDISSPPCLLRLLPAGANRRVGLAPTGKRRLVTAHTLSGHSARVSNRELCRPWTFQNVGAYVSRRGHREILREGNAPPQIL